MYLSYKDFMNVIKYYNEDFKEIADKTKAHWLLDIEMVNKEPFTVLVNMRGRLVNDILITLMSTSYDKKRSK